MAKKRSKKKLVKRKVDKFKTLSHVRQLTKKYYGYGKRKKFKTKQELAEFTRDVYDYYVNFQGSNSQRVTLKKIRDFVRESDVYRRKVKEKQAPKDLPYILPQFEGITPYFILSQIPTSMVGWADIELVSPMMMSKGMRLVSGESYTYEDTFKDFVNYINDLNAKRVSGTSDFYFRLVVEDAKKLKNGNWEIEIISCDNTGAKVDYGFNVKFPDESKVENEKVLKRIIEQQGDDYVPPQKKEPIQEKEATPEKEDKIKEEIKSSELRKVRIAELQQKMSAKIQYANFMKEVDPDEYKAAILEIKEINAQISQIKG